MLVEFTDTAIDFTQTEAVQQHGRRPTTRDAPVVQAGATSSSQEAVNLRASDIHVEPFADRVRVRYRIDGVLVERDAAPRRLLAPLLSRFKIMGQIDIAEKRRPQDGRIKMTVQGKHFDLRVSMLPTVHGQSCVMRILDRGNIQVSIKDLGFGEDDYLRFQQIIKRPNGIFLVTGPTGSGQDDDAVRGAERTEPPGPQDHHGRRPGRVLPARHQPGRGEAQHRARLRPDHPGHAAASPEHHPRRRNSRQGDGGNRRSGVSDRTLGFQHASHERCAQCHHATGGHRRAAVPHRQSPSSPSWPSGWCG